MESEQYKNVTIKYDIIEMEIEILEKKIEEFEDSIQIEIEDLRKKLSGAETKKSTVKKFQFPTSNAYKKEFLYKLMH